jgi:hypothetical protein
MKGRGEDAFRCKESDIFRNQISRRGFYSGNQAAELGAPDRKCRRGAHSLGGCYATISDRAFRPKMRFSPWLNYCSRRVGLSSCEALRWPADSTMFGEISPLHGLSIGAWGRLVVIVLMKVELCVAEHFIGRRLPLRST